MNEHEERQEPERRVVQISGTSYGESEDGQRQEARRDDEEEEGMNDGEV